MPRSAAALETLVDSHEDRVQRLEETYSTLNAEVVGCRGDIKSIETEMRTISSGLNSKLETLESLMREHAQASASNLAKVLERVTPLEDDKRERDVQRGMLKKLAVPGIAASTAAFFAKFGSSIWEWLFGK